MTNRAMPRVVRVGKKAYKIVLLRVVPGKEPTVAREFRRAIRTQRHCIPRCLLKVFGTYDIAAVYQCADFGVDVGRYGSIPHILAANELLAFQWDIGNHARGSCDVFRPSSKAAWGFLLFKVSPKLRDQFGIRIDQLLAHWWSYPETFRKQVAVSVFGSLGWAELIVLVRGAELWQVCEVLNDMGRAEINISDGNRVTKHLFSAKTLSLVGMDFDLTSLRNRDRLKSQFNQPLGKKGIAPTFSITCAPGDMDSAMKLGHELIGEPQSTFGPTDIIFKPKPQSWGEFIASVLRFRKALVGKLYSTRIGILSQLPSDLPSYPSEPQERRGPDVSKKDTDRFMKWGPFFEPYLLNTYYGISSLLQDPLVGECFDDLRPCLDTTLRELIHTKRAEHEESYRGEAGSLIEAITYGAQQRAQGTFLTLENVEGPVSPTKGGIQRVLKAMSSVPLSLFERVDLRWNGFAVVGFKYKGFSSEIQIVNLPFDYLFCPENWWGLFHETGHAAFSESAFVDIGGSKAQSIRLQIYDDLNDPQQRKTWTTAFYEVGAELFDLYFCYGVEIDKYLENIWLYLQGGDRVPQYRQSSQNYFARCFCAYAFWKYLLKEKRTAFAKNMPVARDILEFERRLRKLGVRIDDAIRWRQEAEVYFLRLRPLLEWYASEFRRRAPMRNLREELRSQELRQSLAAIKRGIVWNRPLRNPDAFILGLRTIRHMGFSSRIAAIMTLWNTAVFRARS